MGNTCYFGSTIQNLVQTFLLTEELYLSLSKQLHLDIELPLTKAYLGFLSRGYEANCDQTFQLVFNEFCKKSSRFADRGQHNSHDLFVYFMNCLRDEERRRRGSVNSTGFLNELTVVDKVFGGHTITVYVCTSCKTPYHVCESFLDISIPILGPVDGGEDENEDLFNNNLHVSERQSIQYAVDRADAMRQAVEYTMRPLGDRSLLQKRSPMLESLGEISLEQCLLYYSKIGQIHNEYLCSRCDAEGRPPMTSALKRTLIYNPPAVLVLHLKRFKQTTVEFKKCNQHVTYDEYLDIGPYCSSNSLRNSEPNDVNVWYSLYGVVVHKGSLTSGRYVSYIKVRDCDTRQTKQFMQQFFLNRDQVLNCDDDITRRNASRLIQTHRKEWKPPEVKGQWFLADDEYIKAVDKTEALSQAAYLLFYERVAKSRHQYLENTLLQVLLNDIDVD